MGVGTDSHLNEDLEFDDTFSGFLFVFCKDDSQLEGVPPIIGNWWILKEPDVELETILVWGQLVPVVKNLCRLYCLHKIGKGLQ